MLPAVMLQAACCRVWNWKGPRLCSSYGAMQLSGAEHIWVQITVCSCRLDSLEGEILLHVIAESSVFLLSIFKTLLLKFG